MGSYWRTLITYLKIINDEEVFFMKIMKSLFYQIKVNENELVFFDELENVNCDNEWFYFNLCLLEDDLDLIFDYLIY